ncbi:MAG: type II toxin-antitoxin system HicB family antitoxin [Desulfobacterales bacterium]|nr:type II toxin-antitoxin system HicB family antitoxin [Desulfobacterales bacterium]
MKKDLNYYLALPYKIEIIPIAEEEGGGYLARLPQFGTLGIVGDGDTKEEALADLAENQKDRFRQYIEEGLEIPEPDVEIDEYSGKFVARIPKFLHRELTQAARKNGVSLNQYVCTLLAMNFPSDQMAAALTGMKEEIRFLNQCMGVLKYQLDKSQRSEHCNTRALWADKYPRAA